jgi:tartrate-resistant acid phosphatase type 5
MGAGPEGELHFEPFVHLAGLDDDQVLIAWGGFWFRPFEDGRGWRIVDDQRLHRVEAGRTESIGVRSSPYGHAVVEVFGPDGDLVGRSETDEVNHVWIRGLRPDTEHRYAVTVDGRPWVPDECMRWHRLDDERGELRPAGRTYDCRFRTFPGPGHARSGRFVALGDYGVGIQTGSDAGGHQEHIARLLEQLVDGEPGIDLVITLGDNIYHEEGTSVGGSGSEDDDWYFSYYEPYRFVINRVPVYPAVGNHDAAETEDSDDRAQMADNHFTDLRFSADVEADRDTVALEGDDTPGLFYRFSFGRLVEFLCVDTSESTDAFSADRYFDDDRHQPFLEDALDPDRPDRGRWLVPFAHHPPFCAGPSHDNDHDQIRSLLPRYRRAGVHVVLAGHEHNFQHSIDDGMHLLVCGAGGKLRPERPDRFEDAKTVSWAAEPHLLLIEADHERMTLLPVGRLGDGGEPVAIDARTPAGDAVSLPIVVERDRAHDGS